MGVNFRAPGTHLNERKNKIILTGEAAFAGANAGREDLNKASFCLLGAVIGRDLIITSGIFDESIVEKARRRAQHLLIYDLSLLQHEHR